MNELIKYESQSGLSFKQQVTYSQQHSKVVDTDQDLLTNVINIALGKSIQLTGFKFENNDDYDFLLAEMVKDIQSNAKGLKISEIAIAFERGIKKVYGEWVGISVVTFSGFIRSYLKDEERLQIIRSLEPEKKESDMPKWDGTNRYNELLEEYKKNGSCEDTGNLVYDWLVEIGKIKVGYGSKFYNEAKFQLMQENKKRMLTELNMAIRQTLNKQIESIENNKSNETIVRAKKLAVNAYFKSVI